ncbi:MAG TPA: NAD(P)/FAD-dependent oxidoreductase [Streptosporangiales bacterium]
MTGGPRVVVVGSGLAGPCLAHGLRGAGIEVAVYERDAGIASRGQGYRIHIAPEGSRALRRSLPDELFRLARATAGKPGSGVTVYDPRLSVLNRVTDFGDADPDDEHLSVDRLVLREVMMHGLGDVVHYGKAFTRYEQLPGGRVRAHFDDGDSADADLLVAADGSGSLVRQQFLPHAMVVDTGIAVVFGKAPLTDEVRAMVPEYALDGFSTVVGDDGRFLPLAGMEFRTDPAEAAAELAPGLRFRDTRDYVMWVLGVAVDRVGVPASRLYAMDGRMLTDTVCGVIADWHPTLGRIVERSDPGTVKASSMRTSVPVPAWESGPVTLVGDAIHCMVPAGIGAAVALRDAAELADRVVAAARGGIPLVAAVHDYEAAMLRYGFAAVAASQQVGRQFTQ